MGGRKMCVQVFAHAVRTWWMKRRNEQRVAPVVVASVAMIADFPVALIQVSWEHVVIAEGQRRFHSQCLPRKGVLTSMGGAAK
jgi:hypothetical protein